jgi:hypothetical protein
MLALTGKVASLYVQKFDDADSVAAVSELEQLSTGLSRKIWQKIIASRSVVPGLHEPLKPNADPPLAETQAATSPLTADANDRHDSSDSSAAGKE